MFLWKQKPSESLNNETDWEGSDGTSLLAVHVSVSNPSALNGEHSNGDGNWNLIIDFMRTELFLSNVLGHLDDLLKKHFLLLLIHRS